MGLRFVILAPCLARFFAPMAAPPTRVQPAVQAPDPASEPQRWVPQRSGSAPPGAARPELPRRPLLPSVAFFAGLGFAALAVGGGGRTCAWEVSHSLTKPAQGPVATFLRREGAVEEIVLLNTSVQRLTPEAAAGRYTAHLAAVKFPGASVRPTVRFEAVPLEDGLMMKAHDMVTQGEGPSFFMSLMENLVPDITSSTTIRAQDGMTYSHTLKIEFPLPFWWPVPDGVMSRVGRKVLQSSTRKDVEATASKLRDRYEAWKRDESSEMASADCELAVSAQ